MSTVIEIKGIQLRPLTVQQILDLQEAEYQLRRRRLLQDLDDADAGEQTRVDRLQELQKTRDSLMPVLEAGLRGMRQIVSAALQNGTTIDDLGLTHEEQTDLALRLLGERPDPPSTGTSTEP